MKSVLFQFSKPSMTRKDISFQTSDNVTLRGWLYTPDSASSYKIRLPCLVMCHGFSAVKEMDLNVFGEYFVSQLDLACLIFDHRGFGSSDQAQGAPRFEIIPSLQLSDLSDAITYAQSLDVIDPDKIGLWGSSYSGGHVLHAAAADKRVKAVISQVPFVNGWETYSRFIRPDFLTTLDASFSADRSARASGKDAATLAVVDPDPQKPSALPTPDSFAFFSAWESKSPWVNEVTLKSLEYLRSYHPASCIGQISPIPILMVVATNDVVSPTDLALRAYDQALEPKKLFMLRGGHFDAYSGPNFEQNSTQQAEFLKATLCGRN